MALQLGALNQALRQAGVSDDLARQAAEEVATYEDRLAPIDLRMGRIEQAIAELRGEVRALAGRLAAQQWVIGLTIALNIAILVKLFVH